MEKDGFLISVEIKIHKIPCGASIILNNQKVKLQKIVYFKLRHIVINLTNLNIKLISTKTVTLFYMYL